VTAGSITAWNTCSTGLRIIISAFATGESLSDRGMVRLRTFLGWVASTYRRSGRPWKSISAKKSEGRLSNNSFEQFVARDGEQNEPFTATTTLDDPQTKCRCRRGSSASVGILFAHLFAESFAPRASIVRAARSRVSIRASQVFGNRFFEFVAVVLLFYALSYAVAYAGGRLVERGLRVNYTRKIHHFAIVTLPWIVRSALGLENNGLVMGLAVFLLPFHLLLFCLPIRSRIPAVATMFRCVDRPEDRPHTLFWLATQYAAVCTIFPLLYALLAARGVESWLGIVIAVIAFGDGLAEPVGVAFGRHAYSVAAFGTSKQYRRTWEGSACVALAAVVAVLFFRNTFTDLQFALGLSILPISAAIAEARSPHTLDAPFLFLVLGAELLLLSYF
jgi:dolichol kinase